ncbi:MAG: SUMF1/EgtB/PvdO family nonheme iron enzyme [Methylococcales bacterium]|nr:SUMF1/EgtB/PvdO family nonheme iron enzyme [Methylococcales bacterium]
MTDPKLATPKIHQIYHVFLASPGDMNEEREMVREFFDAYNRNIANRQDIEFKVIDWENYSTSGVGRPQALITQQTLEAFRPSLVLVVGLLGQRFGTPTDIYESGTEEEFATAIGFRNEQGDWPEIKWFFRETWGKQGPPNNPKQVKEAGDQWQKVLDFKEKIQTSNPPLYTIDFPSTDDFPAVFRQDLELWLHDPVRPWNLKDANQTGIPEIALPAQESPYLKIWLNLLANECAHLPLEILDARQGMEQTDPIGLPDIFVPLKAMAPSDDWKQTREQNLALARDMAAGGKSKPVPVLDLLRQHRLAVLIGEPGSGKSALVNQLAWSLLASGQQQALPTTLQGLLPLRLILRSVDMPAEAKQGQQSWLWDSVEKDIRETLEIRQQAGQHAKAVLDSLKQQLMHPPGGLILLDGLDEVPAVDQRRLRLLQAIQDLVASLPDHTRFIVTARPYAYTDPRWRLKGFSAFFLTPFDQEQRAQFIRGWYDAARSRFMLKETELKQRIPDLIDRVENQPHLRELAERPLLLTLISNLHASGGRLPEDRAQLYERSVDLLLHHWRREVFRDSDGQLMRLDSGELLTGLQTLAYNAHKAQQQQADAAHTADISQAAIQAVFEPVLAKLGRDDLLAFLQQHTGILIARERNRFAFPHRSFQEYLAMGWLTSQTEDKLSPEVCTDPLWWREVFLLAVIQQQNNPRFALSYIRDVLDSGRHQPESIRQRLSILGGLALMELHQQGSSDLIDKVRLGLIQLLEDSTALNVSERAEAGRVLGYIGDHRPGVGLTDQGLPDIAWVKIPPGEVNLRHDMGSLFQVESFYLARYPVTNAQFQAFIDDPAGYANPRWWAELAAKPETPKLPCWTEANHPRETVSWFEAMAFCAWLSERLGYAIHLPTEWQWQQAACSGQAGFNYPWGPDYLTGYANINETWGHVGPHYLQRPTAVGLYPQGHSLQGVADLSGNILEWCLNAYQEPSNTQKAGLFARVVRGSSWDYYHGNACASYRYFNSPDGRYGAFGFRVSCASPI